MGSNLIYNDKVLFIAAVIILLAILLLVSRLFSLYGRLSASFSKLSFVIREDSKKYFTSSAQKSIELQEEHENNNKKIIKEAVTELLANEQEVINKAMIAARKEADLLIQDAKKESVQIIEKSKNESEQLLKQNLEKTAYIIESVMSDYILKEFKINDHEYFIESAITNYLKHDND